MEAAFNCSADFPVCGFSGLSSPLLERATGKSPEPAGWKACSITRSVIASLWVNEFIEIQNDAAHLLQRGSPCLAA